MPIIKSAKKQMKQSRVKRTRNFRTRRMLKDAIKAVEVSVKEGDKKKAEQDLQTAYKVIDTSAKKNLIHKNNAARKKSLLARHIATMSEKKAAAPAKAEKKAPAKKEAPKKEVKAEAKKEEKAE